MRPYYTEVPSEKISTTKIFHKYHGREIIEVPECHNFIAELRNQNFTELRKQNALQELWESNFTIVSKHNSK